MTAFTSGRTSVDTTTDSFLRFALRLDAVLTGVMGLGTVALAPRIAEFSGTTAAFEYTMGAFFVVYGAVVYGLSMMRHVRLPGTVIAIGNVVYALAALALVLAGMFPLTTAGVVLTLGSGVFTLVMADLQYIGVRRARA
jgi:glucose uptake protein GlcU